MDKIYFGREVFIPDAKNVIYLLAVFGFVFSAKNRFVQIALKLIVINVD